MANNELQVIYTANTKAFERSARKVKKELNGFEKTASNLGKNLAGVFAVGAVVQLGRSIVSTTAKFQRFEAVLTKTLGSKSEAQSALRQITQFASKTPFQVDDLTDSFVKLANQGFKPTINQMRQLGDLAASQGKSFNQLSEAILDAQVGEFERLKEFGIRASKQGDKVTFAFKGVEKQVNFSSDAIQGYILGLGDVEGVSGGMVAISETLGGKISNLNDNWEQLKLTMGTVASDGGAGGIVGWLSDLTSHINLLVLGVDRLKELKFQDLLSKAAKKGVKSYKEYIEVTESLEGAQFNLVKTQNKYLEGLKAQRKATDENGDHEDQIFIEEQVKILDEQIAAIEKYIALQAEKGNVVVEATAKQKTILEKLDESLRLVTASEGVLGTEYTRTAERIALYQKALIALKASQDPHIESINAVSDALERQQGLLKEAPDALTGEGLGQPNLPKSAAPTFDGEGAEFAGGINMEEEAHKAMEFRKLMEGVGESVGFTFENIANEFGNLFNSLLQDGKLTFLNLVKGLGMIIAKLLIAMGIAAAFRAIMGDPTAGARGASAAASVAGGLMASLAGIPMMAEGGVTNGPTLAMIGEGKEQEAVLPLSKLAGLMSGGFGINSRQSSVSTNSSAMSRVSSSNQANSSAMLANIQLRLEGNDLVGSIQRTFKNNGSSGGAVSFG